MLETKQGVSNSESEFQESWINPTWSNCSYRYLLSLLCIHYIAQIFLTQKWSFQYQIAFLDCILQTCQQYRFPHSKNLQIKREYKIYRFDIVVMICSRKMILITNVKMQKLYSSWLVQKYILLILVKLHKIYFANFCQSGWWLNSYCALLDFWNFFSAQHFNHLHLIRVLEKKKTKYALIFDSSLHCILELDTILWYFVGNHLTILSRKEVLNSRLTLSSGILATMTAEQQIENRTETDLYSRSTLFWFWGEFLYQEVFVFYKALPWPSTWLN